MKIIKTLAILSLSIFLTACKTNRVSIISKTDAKKSDEKEYTYKLPAGDFEVRYQKGQYSIRTSQYKNPREYLYERKYYTADHLAVDPGFGILLWNQGESDKAFDTRNGFKNDTDWKDQFVFIDAKTGLQETCRDHVGSQEPYKECLTLGNTHGTPSQTNRVVLLDGYCYYGWYRFNAETKPCPNPPRVVLFENNKVTKTWSPLPLYWDMGQWFHWLDDRVLFVSKEEDGITYGNWLDTDGNIDSIAGFKVLLGENKKQTILEPDMNGGYRIVKPGGYWLPEGAVSVVPMIKTRLKPPPLYNLNWKEKPLTTGDVVSGWFVLYPDKAGKGRQIAWATRDFKKITTPRWNDIRVESVNANFAHWEEYDLYLLKNIKTGLWEPLIRPKSEKSFTDISHRSRESVGKPGKDIDKLVKNAIYRIDQNTKTTYVRGQIKFDKRMARQKEERHQKNLKIRKKIQAEYARRQAEQAKKATRSYNDSGPNYINIPNVDARSEQRKLEDYGRELDKKFINKVR